MRIAARLLLPFLIAQAAARAGDFEFDFKDGDRIALLGGTIIEREQKFGFLETELTLAVGPKTISVRNLGWSGDTVFGTARSYFGPPAEGIERLTKHFEMLQPTVLLACYGHDVALDRELKIEDFVAGYGALLDLARSKSPGLRIIVVAPPPFENLGAPLPDMNGANARLASVRDALKAFAAKQRAAFVDTFALMGGAKKERTAQPLTDNGIHYGESGYKLWAKHVVAGLGLKMPPGAVDEAGALRQAVIRKDFLFFNRWRPANETYLFGFRKHEQGKNGAEMEQFDPIIAAQEKKILDLKTAALSGKKLP
jgi:lysophospholipase L1-like esterase